MCIIYACHSGLPSDTLLERGAARNRDGAGVAWIDPKEKKVRWKKGLKSEVAPVREVLDTLGEENYPILIHYRTGSAGWKIPKLTHPFPVTAQVDLKLEGAMRGAVLMHNGHWGAWKDTLKRFCLDHKLKLPEGPWSDTRAYALFAYHLGEEILPLLDTTDRIIILDSDGRWNYWGDWKDPKEYGEEGFILSTDLATSSAITQRGDKRWSADNPLYPSQREPFWTPGTTGRGESGKGAEKGGEKAPSLGSPNSGDGGRNTVPLVIIPGEEGTQMSKSTSGTTDSHVPPAKGSSSTLSHVRRTIAPIPPASMLDVMKLSEGDRVSLGNLEAIWVTLRTKNGMALERGH